MIVSGSAWQNWGLFQDELRSALHGIWQSVLVQFSNLNFLFKLWLQKDVIYVWAGIQDPKIPNFAGFYDPSQFSIHQTLSLLKSLHNTLYALLSLNSSSQKRIITCSAISFQYLRLFEILTHKLHLCPVCERRELLLRPPWHGFEHLLRGCDCHKDYA